MNLLCYDFSKNGFLQKTTFIVIPTGILNLLIHPLYKFAYSHLFFKSKFDYKSMYYGLTYTMQFRIQMQLIRYFVYDYVIGRQSKDFYEDSNLKQIIKGISISGLVSGLLCNSSRVMSTLIFSLQHPIQKLKQMNNYQKLNFYIKQNKLMNRILARYSIFYFSLLNTIQMFTQTLVLHKSYLFKIVGFVGFFFVDLLIQLLNLKGYYYIIRNQKLNLYQIIQRVGVRQVLYCSVPNILFVYLSFLSFNLVKHQQYKALKSYQVRLNKQ